MRKHLKLGAALLLAALPFFGLFRNSTFAQSRGTDIAVVVNADTPVTDLSVAEVRKVFLGDRQYWNAKLPVVLLMRAPATRERDVVLRVIYQMSEEQYKQYWVAKVYRSEVTGAPKVVYSDEMQYGLVSAMPGAITTVDGRNVHPGVKIVRVDGMLPGERGYPLR